MTLKQEKRARSSPRVSCRLRKTQNGNRTRRAKKKGSRRKSISSVSTPVWNRARASMQRLTRQSFPLSSLRARGTAARREDISLLGRTQPPTAAVMDRICAGLDDDAWPRVDVLPQAPGRPARLSGERLRARARGDVLRRELRDV